MIVSLANAQVKRVRALARKKERYAAQQFVLEGVRLIEEAMEARVPPSLVLHTTNIEDDARGRALLARARAATQVFAVSDAVMRALTTTETPPGIVAIAPFVELPLPSPPQFVLILDAVRDPGNVGTLLRAARAAGVDAVFLAPGTADPYNPKVVRAAMGAHFVVPLRVALWEEITDALRLVSRVYLADARGETTYTRVDWSRPLALIIGGEAEGASDAAKRIATSRVAIPMRGGAESLNAAMAGTLLLFQAARRVDSDREQQVSLD